MQTQTYSPSLISISGDFNTGNVYLEPKCAQQHSGITHHDILLQDVVLGLNLQQLIREPTRISTAANLRDRYWLMAVDNTKVSAYSILSPFSEIDHIPMYIHQH